MSSVQIWGQKRLFDAYLDGSYQIECLRNHWFADVRNALDKQNVELPSGKLTGANTELMVKRLEIYLQKRIQRYYHFS